LRLGPPRSKIIADHQTLGKTNNGLDHTHPLVEICIGLEINGYLPAEF
jgi:hypothetical protein